MSLYASIESLLAAHDIPPDSELPLEHAGFSGAVLSTVRRHDGTRFILKRLSAARDWIMYATADTQYREAQFAIARLDLGERARTPTMAVARDGDGFALLMVDITGDLFPAGPITPAACVRLVDGMAELHRAPLVTGVSWCPLDRRLLLLTPASAATAARFGAPVAADIVAGWRSFSELASPTARTTIESLMSDVSPLVRALKRHGAAFLHGDLKLDNIGLSPAGDLWFLDWSMPLVASPAVEVGWFLAVNSRRLPLPLDDVIRAYADTAVIRPDLRDELAGLTAICGLLLRGWRKALDGAEGEREELKWWCDRVEAAQPLLRR